MGTVYQPTYGTDERQLGNIAKNASVSIGGSPIESAFSRTRAALEVMDDRIADLEKRLYPLLMPAETGLKAGCADGPDAPPISPMQENVDALTSSVLRQSERLRTLLDYLQV